MSLVGQTLGYQGSLCPFRVQLVVEMRLEFGGKLPLFMLAGEWELTASRGRQTSDSHFMACRRAALSSDLGF